jgi:phage gp46-like protein
MTDIGMFIIDNCVQLKLENGDIAGDDGLETAVLISLFSDQRVSEADVEVDGESRRGWWGDVLADVEGDQIGSKLWLLSRSKIIQSIIPQVETSCTNALQWLLDDGVAASISVEASLVENSGVLIQLSITKPLGENDRYSLIWDGQDLKRA